MTKKDSYPYGELGIIAYELHEAYHSFSNTCLKKQKKLKKLIDICSSDQDCEEVLVYQSGVAISKELQNDIHGAVTHREKEIPLIEKLHIITDDPNVLIGYEVEILEERKKILKKLNQKLERI